MLTHDASHLDDYLRLIRQSRRLDRSRCTAKRRVALLADFATQQLAQVLETLFVRAGIDATFYAAEYDTIQQEVYSPESELYAFKPDIVVLFPCTMAFRGRYYETQGDRAQLAEEIAQETLARWDAIKQRVPATIVQANYVMPYERQFGHFDHKVAESLPAVVAALNTRIAELARTRPHVLLLDVESVASWVGRRHFVDERLWTIAKGLCALDQLPHVAQALVDVVLSTTGRGVKCVVLDLDNTLWGGVVGDDGLEGIAIGILGEGEPFRRFQYYLRELKRRGIVLAVCSKNEHDAAIRPFREHPEMVLREPDIAVFVANWNTKVDNIKAIREALNIGFDAMVFLDDNPFERNIVRQYLPDVIVPELPEEPSDYVRALTELNLFETSSFTEEDRQRADLYREESSRRALEKSYTNVEDYLQSLEMKVSVERFDAFHLPRIAQLIQRSNQFNLTTRRYGLAECEAMMRDEARCVPLYVRLSDRFGDYGLISVVALRFDDAEPNVARVDTWLMSCRVLARGVEEFVMNRVVALARERGCGVVVGEYIPTAKNKMVKDFFGRFGFRKTREEAATGATTWVLEVDAYAPKQTFLQETMAS